MPECDACGYSSPDLVVKHYDSLTIPDGTALCALCAGTFAGSALQYPTQFPNEDVLNCVCYVGNAIIEEIRKNHA